MTRSSVRALVGIAIGIWLGMAAPAHAQTQESGLPTLPPLIVTVNPDKTMTGVNERYRPDYAPVGIRAGSFDIYPAVRLGLGYDSNIFATDADHTSDAFYIVEPSVTAKSNWSRSQLNLRARGTLLNFFSTPHVAENTFEFGADGSMDLSQSAHLETGGEFAREIERRDSSAFPEGVVAPVAYDVSNSYIRGVFDTGRTRLIGSADVTRFDFKSTEALSTDGSGIEVPLDQNYRDRTIARGTARGDLAIAAAGTVYLQGTYSSISYDTAFISSTGLPNRDANEAQALIGTEWTFSLLHADFAIGYVHHNYDNPLYPTIAGLAFHGNIQYLFTPLVTLTATADRSVEETSILGSSGFFSSRVGIRADYELLRNLILNANVSYRQNDFKIIPRTDTIFRLGAGARYLANRWFGIEADAFYTRRDVKNAAFVPNYNDFRFSIRTVFQF